MRALMLRPWSLRGVEQTSGVQFVAPDSTNILITSLFLMRYFCLKVDEIHFWWLNLLKSPPYVPKSRTFPLLTLTMIPGRSAGFDITLFKSGSGSGVDGMWVNRELCRIVEDGPKPVVAAIRWVRTLPLCFNPPALAQQ